MFSAYTVCVALPTPLHCNPVVWILSGLSVSIAESERVIGYMQRGHQEPLSFLHVCWASHLEVESIFFSPKSGMAL